MLTTSCSPTMRNLFAWWPWRCKSQRHHIYLLKRFIYYEYVLNGYNRQTVLGWLIIFLTKLKTTSFTIIGTHTHTHAHTFILYTKNTIPNKSRSLIRIETIYICIDKVKILLCTSRNSLYLYQFTYRYVLLLQQ